MISVRILWPFARLVSNPDKDIETLGGGAIDPAILADPDARVPVSLYRKLLLCWRDKTGDPAFGIHAAELLETADFAIVHRAVRNSANVREAMLCFARYTKILADTLSGVLIEEGERATWQLQYEGSSPLTITNDFMVTAAWRTMRRILSPNSLREVHVRHESATDAAEYARVFAVPVRFGRTHNALVVARSSLDVPLVHGNRGLFDIFNRRAQQVLEQLTPRTGFEARVKQLLLAQLDEGEVQITKTARRLDMSAATLRRRLAEQGTTYTEVLDHVRRELAVHHLRERRLTVGEIAFVLGFSSQSAFGRAFRRWHGMSPLSYRRKRMGPALRFETISE